MRHFKGVFVFFIVTISFSFPLMTLEAHAGNGKGNGGYAHVCRDEKKKITSAQLLDLWEAQQFTPYRLNTPIDDQINLALKKVESIIPSLKAHLEWNLSSFRNNVVYTDRSLTPTEDAFPPYAAGEGCTYEQVARFEEVLTETGAQGLRVNREIYESPLFSQTDRAALFIHEALYFLDRLSNHSTSSHRIRPIVAHLFSDSSVPTIVRLGMGSLLSRERQTTSGETLSTPIISYPDPLSLKGKVLIDQLDGMELATSNRSKDLYRCSFRTGYELKTVSRTPWLPANQFLTSRVSLEPSPLNFEIPFLPSEYDPKLHALYPFGPPTLVTGECEAKDSKGRIRNVKSRIGVIFPKEASCLAVLQDGATISFPGDRCLCMVTWDDLTSTTLEGPQVQDFQIVRSEK